MKSMLWAGAAGMLTVATAPAGAAEPSLAFVFEEVVTLGPAVTPGETARGLRRIIPITGGTFEGPEVKGEIVPGGWDWQLQRGDGCTEVEADYFLKTDDGVVINVVNTGVICPGKPGEPPRPVRTHPVFEAPKGKYEWLNQTAFVGTLEAAPADKGPAVRIRFYQVR